jgi:predicted O-methyltransferase YrrM
MNWLFQNFGARFRFALRHPRYVATSLLREVTLADERFLSSVTGASPSRIRSFLDEPAETPDFVECLREAAVFLHRAEIEGADLYAKKILLQYAAIRAFAPDMVVETGVASGVSTSYMLLALQKNGRGTLHSIEIGDSRYLPAGKLPGWIVPDWLKPSWSIHFGDSRTLLPQLLQQLGSIDVFIHDSLHTYDHMQYEYRTAYPYIRPGGLLFSDDAEWNPAFREFQVEVQAGRAGVLRGVGFLKKCQM